MELRQQCEWSEKSFRPRWLREFYQYDVLSDLSQVTCPVLVIAGEKDIQVPPKAGENVISTVSGEAEFHVIKNMTHILKCWEGIMDPVNTIKIYKRLTDSPLPDDIKSCLTAWVTKHFIYESVKDEQFVGK